MIYNHIFVGYYNKFPKLNGKLICWIIYSTILFGISIWLTYFIIKLTKKNENIIEKYY